MGCSPSRGQAPISGPSSPLNQITSLTQITWLAEVPRSTEALLSGGTFQGLRGDLPGTDNKALTAHHETNVAKCSRSGRTLIRLSPQIPMEQNFPKRVLWNPSPSAHDGEETSKIKEPSEPLQQGPSSLLSQRPTLALQEPLPLETLSHFPSPGIPLSYPQSSFHALGGSTIAPGAKSLQPKGFSLTPSSRQPRRLTSCPAGALAHVSSIFLADGLT